MKDTLDLSEEGPQLPDQYTDRAFHRWEGGREEGRKEGRKGGREIQDVS